MGKKRQKGLTEYETFKKFEPEYIESKMSTNKKKRKDWIGWLVAIIVLSTSIYFVIGHMMATRDAVYDSAQVARLSASEAVEQMFDRDDEGNLTYIRRDLTQNEYNQIEEMVEGVPESSEKVQITILLRTAGEQLESQLYALELIEGLQTPNGEPNVDLAGIDILMDMDNFPRNYNPEYAQELEDEYVRLAGVIRGAIDLEARIRDLAVNNDDNLILEEIDSLNDQVEALPFSDRKSKLTNDIKALYQAYEEQLERLEEQRVEEERRKAEQERYRQEQEAIRKREAERLAEQERREQERIAEEQAEQRRRQEEQDRLQREEQERIRQEQERQEQERQEQERIERERRERDEQQRLEEEARLEREREERERLERERLEREERERQEEEARQQQEQDENTGQDDVD